jgi:hypothetical protein
MKTSNVKKKKKSINKSLKIVNKKIFNATFYIKSKHIVTYTYYY